jgi:penicillin amidase
VFFSTPLLRVINLSIALLLLALAAVVYWYAWRPLAQTSGEISAPISAQAAVARDAIGVPHITAATTEDAIFLQGFVTAQDRMWQMDALRRLAAGELAEVVGPQALSSDQDARRLRLIRLADEFEQSMPGSDRAILAAYARGVNFFLETHRDKLPLEFKLLNYDPRPWRMRDSILCGLHMYRTLTTSWRDEISKLHMLQQGDRGKVEALFPVRSGGESQPGSNAWALSAARSTTGKPILANDPHLDFSIPATWYMIHLRAGDLNATGVSLPGVPAIIIGHNQRIAWGVTNLQFDVQDLYREQIDPQSGRYVFQGKIEQARLERTAIGVKGANPVVFEQWITRHGPVFLEDENQRYSLRWTAAEPSSFEFPFLDIDRARNWTEFNAALARFSGPGQNFVYADVDGNIGYHATGKLPIRPPDCRGDVPADGAAGNCEWQGFIPFDDLPNFFNPPSGEIVTANQNPFPEDYRYAVAGDFAAYFRSHEIRTLLDRKAKWQPQEMLAIEKDVYSMLSYFIAQQVVRAADARKSGDRNAIDLLRSWNGQMEKGAAAPMLAALIYDQLKKLLVERAAPGSTEPYAVFIAPAVVEKILRERPPDWFPDYDALLLKALSNAVEEGAKVEGSKISRWDYGQYNRLRITNPVEGQLPLIGKYFDIGPVSMSGSPTSIKQSSGHLGPSMRMIVDFSDLDRSLQNVTIGESGQPLSKHYKDQWASYYGATSFPMQFQRVDVRETLRITPQRLH